MAGFDICRSSCCNNIYNFCIVYFDEIKNIVTNKVRYLFKAYKNSKQMDCCHVWRKKDGEYYCGVATYRYRCEKCKLDRELSGDSAKQFEEDFLSDY